MIQRNVFNVEDYLEENREFIFKLDSIRERYRRMLQVDFKKDKVAISRLKRSSVK
jgi:hypothetical protein